MSSEDTLGLVGVTVADKYRVESVVGEGGFAVVYRAIHQIWKRPVALKVFKALGDVPADERDRLLDDFIREGALLAELSEKSASICQARDIGMMTTPDGMTVPYMVLEWLEGRSLEDVLLEEREHRMLPRTIDEAVRLIGPAAEALALAHKMGVAHRDVKPANLFLLGDPRSDSCTVKVLDFGIAKVVQDAQKMGGAFTKTGGQVTSFTPAYGAPEQFSRSYGSTGPWTDVFALALVLVEITTGKPPLDGDDFMQIAYASADKNVRPTPRTRGAGVTDPVEGVFNGALAVSPNDRYRTVGQFWNALRMALGFEPLRALDGSATSGRSSLVGSAATVSAQGAPSPRLAPPSAANPLALTPAAMSDTRNAPISVGPQSKTAVSATAPKLSATGATQLAADSMGRPPGSFPSTSTTQPRPGEGRKVPVVAIALGCLAIGALGGAFLYMRPASSGSGGAGGVASASPPPAGSAASPPPSAAPPASAATVSASPCPKGMIFIPGGEFFMGSDEQKDKPEEKPAHQVKLSPFCIDETEVTTEAYVSCSDNGGCKRASIVNQWKGIGASDKETYDPLCNLRDPQGHGKHPINCVDWQMAEDYCEKVHDKTQGRLPTEAEWEFAARGPDGRRYPWGDDDPTGGHLNACGTECVAWAKQHGIDYLKAMYDADDKFPNTAPVGSFPAGKSRYGLEDVVGNVWEWVGDWYGRYEAKPKDEPVDPKGPVKGTKRVIRGGGWTGSDPSWVRPTFRYSNDPSDKNYGIGFRCAASPKT